jgi:hypothetical protein
LVADIASAFRSYGIPLSKIGSEATIGLMRPHNASDDLSHAVDQIPPHMNGDGHPEHVVAIGRTWSI